MREIGEAADVDTAVRAALRAGCDAGGFVLGEAWTLLPDGTGMEVRPTSIHASEALHRFTQRLEGVVVKPGFGLPGRAWEARRPVWVEDVMRDPQFLRRRFAGDLHLRAGFAAPVVVADRVALVLVFFAREARREDRRFVARFAEVAGQLAACLTRHRVREGALASAALFRRVFDEGPIGMALVDRDLRMIQANEALCRMLGYTHEELARLSASDITHPDDVEAGVALARRLFAGEIPAYRRDKRYVRKDGTVIWGTLTTSVIHDSTGAPLCSLGIVEDITERKRAEALTRASEERYRSLFERSPAGMFVALADGRVLQCNDAFARMLGFPSRDAALAGNVRDLCVEPAEWERLMVGLRLVGAAANLEIRLRGPEGASLWTLMNVTRVADDPEPRVEGQVVDVTERRRDEEAIRAREALRSVAALAEATAHEINNPLAVLVGRLGLLARRVADDEGAAREVDKALDAARQLHETLERMLRITRLEIHEGRGWLPPMLDLPRSAGGPDAPATEPGG
jgi:PAS domain S-box-containing protein